MSGKTLTSASYMLAKPGSLREHPSVRLVQNQVAGPLAISCPHGVYETHVWTHVGGAIGLAVRGGNTECTDTGCLGTVYRFGSKCTGIPEPTQGTELSLCLSLSPHTHAHACTHTHTHTRTRTHTHTHIMHTLPPSPPPSLGRIFSPPSTYTSPRLPTFPHSLSIAPANMPLAAQQGTL